MKASLESAILLLLRYNWSNCVNKIKEVSKTISGATKPGVKPIPKEFWWWRENDQQKV